MVIGVFTPESLMKEKRFEFKNRPAGFLGSILIGMAFAAGWTPCTGPILAAVIALASQQSRVGDDLYVGLRARVCHPVLRFVLLPGEDEVDQKEHGPHHENWRFYHDCCGDHVVLRLDDQTPWIPDLCL